MHSTAQRCKGVHSPGHQVEVPPAGAATSVCCQPASQHTGHAAACVCAGFPQVAAALRDADAAFPSAAGPQQPIKLPRQHNVDKEEYKEFLNLGHGEIFSLDLDRWAGGGRGLCGAWRCAEQLAECCARQFVECVVMRFART